VYPARDYAEGVLLKRLLGLGAVAICALVVGAGTAMAVERPSAGPFAEFRACMKANGAPALGHRLSAEERAALRRAFATCRGLLPKRTFARPSAAQVAAFKSCMADKGFSSRPNLRDPAVRKAVSAALRECLPLLKK
jgi:hypothetical protein